MPNKEEGWPEEFGLVLADKSGMLTVELAEKYREDEFDDGLREVEKRQADPNYIEIPKEVLAKEYPNIAACVEILELDNGGEFPAPDKGAKRMALLEKQAARLDEYDKEAFMAGEEDDMLALVKAYRINRLHEYMNEVFEAGL